MRRGLVGLLVLGLFGCKSNGIDRDAALAAAREQAEEVGKAARDDDHERMADLNHPKLVESLGGRAMFIRLLEKTAALRARRGLHIEEVVIGEPDQLAESSGTLYTIVPMETKVSGPKNLSISQSSFLIAVSTDRGKTWKYLGAAGVEVDREKLKQLLPGFPDELKLPAQEPTNPE
jgi:hypothetical protein